MGIQYQGRNGARNSFLRRKQNRIRQAPLRVMYLEGTGLGLEEKVGLCPESPSTVYQFASVVSISCRRYRFGPPRRVYTYDYHTWLLRALRGNVADGYTSQDVHRSQDVYKFVRSRRVHVA